MSSEEATPLQRAIRAAINASGKSRDALDGQLKGKLGTSGKPLHDIERGKSKRPQPATLAAIEDVLGLQRGKLSSIVYEGTIAAPAPDQAPTRTADAGETAPVLRLDLSYSMGPGTDLDESYIEGEHFSFDLGFLRTMTITPPDRIRVVDGVGDSMQPTIHDRDLLFVDINQRDMNAQDRIWACWIYGMGAVKRLRAIDPDRILVISDNPSIDDQVVSRKDILIHGRVVGSIKRH